LRVYTNAGQSGAALYVSGNFYYTGSFSNTSDKRFKSNIATIDNSLSKILALRGVSFNWKSDSEIRTLTAGSKNFGEEDQPIYFPEGKQIGLVAQEVETVIPQIVQTDIDGFKSIDYTKLGPVLIEAIKEQQKIIDDLKKRLEILEGKK